MKKDSPVTSTLTAVLTIFVFIIAFLLISLNIKVSQKADTNINNDSYVSGNTQYIDITAKGGYSPSIINAKSGVATVLKVKTSNTYDCSSALVIPSIGFRTNLPPSGTTEVSIPAQAANTELKGTCSMGMYKFLIKFI